MIKLWQCGRVIDYGVVPSSGRTTYLARRVGLLYAGKEEVHVCVFSRACTYVCVSVCTCVCLGRGGGVEYTGGSGRERGSDVRGHGGRVTWRWEQQRVGLRMASAPRWSAPCPSHSSLASLPLVHAETPSPFTLSPSDEWRVVGQTLLSAA